MDFIMMMTCSLGGWMGEWVHLQTPELHFVTRHAFCASANFHSIFDMELK